MRVLLNLVLDKLMVTDPADMTFQSAIGEGMPRRDHADVSNQVRCQF